MKTPIENLEPLLTTESIKKNSNENSSISSKIDEIILEPLENYIILSSDDEIIDEKNFETPKKKLKELKEEIITKRKITKSNLKYICAKDHPASQTKLENYFTVNENYKVKYFDIFEKSDKPSPTQNKSNAITNTNNVSKSIGNKVSASNKNSNSDSNVLIISSSDSDTKTNKLKKNYSLSKRKTKKDTVEEHFQPKRRSLRSKNLIDKISQNDQNKSSNKMKMKNKNQNLVKSKKTNLTTKSDSLSLDNNSIPSIKTESEIYSLDEDAVVNTVCENSLDSLASDSNKNAFENDIRRSDIDNTISKKPIKQKRVCRKLLYNKIKPNSKDQKIKKINNCPSENATKSMTTSSTFSNNSSNSAIKVNKKLTTINTKDKNRRKIKCPSYKVVEGTTFAVDGFRFGEIDGVTHYFLTHFHGDHYIGLRKSFSFPIYMSQITASLVETFIRVSPEYIKVININESIFIGDIEVNAIDANHCPGAVMFAFKLPCGKCLLHTGDFRACPEMESESYFWNNHIDTLYLDTTYLNKNYDFKPQSESIVDVREYVETFRKKHIGKNILYVCGSYVIGKEKVWREVAEITEHRVYTDGNRLKALNAIGNPELLKHLIHDPKEANIHVVTMNELYYNKLYEYFQLYSDHFDIVLGIRPTGWEKNSKPRLGGIINIVGIEYSEHSSYAELRRFVRYLQPKLVISTVPISNKNISITAKIPNAWMKDILKPQQQAYQPTITSFICTRKQNNKENYINDDQMPTCSKYLGTNDTLSDIGMLDISKSSTKNVNKSKDIDITSDQISDWMS